VKVESGAGSGRVDGSASCCMTRSQGHQCGAIGMNFLAHIIHTHTHNYMCTRRYSAYVHCLCRPLACCCTGKASHTDTTSQLLLHLQHCLNDYKISMYGW